MPTEGNPTPPRDAELEKQDIERFRAETDRCRAETERRRADIEDARLQIEKDRYALEVLRAELARRELQRPLVEGLFRFADLTVRSLLILNGGAALGLLTFVTNNARYDLSTLVFYFGLGAWLSVATAAMSYVAQVLILEPKSDPVKFWCGGGARMAAIVLGLSALLIFGYGMLEVSKKITPPKTTVLTIL